jgi:carboxypeptidase Taq
MNPKLRELKDLLAEVNDLESAAALLSWDQMTYMPPGGAAARGRQLATLKQISHEKFTSRQIGKLLDELRPYAESLTGDADDAALIRVTARDYKKAIKVPAPFMAEFSNHTTAIYEAWTKAREVSDFKIVEPYLEKTLDLSRQLADFFPGYERIADPLIDFADEGMKASTISHLFKQLRQELVPLVRTITSQPEIDDSCLRLTFPEMRQLQFGQEIIKRLGYDFERGRQDKSPHPFTINFSINDVRITTRVKENNLTEALFSSIHEAGHALYEQGINPEYEGTLLAGGASSGVHESQSRLWENLIGRSRCFWQYFYPKLQAVFPDQLHSVSPDKFYRAINKVQKSLIRTDADEVTYNLHVMLRFDFEMDLLEGRLTVKDLPEAWAERFRQDLGLIPPDANHGALQDMHWFSGTIGGAFQCYTLGNIMSAQFMEAAKRAYPGIELEIAGGDFETLHRWLKQNIYQYGRKYNAEELVTRVTGQSIGIEPYIRYLQGKYSELYKI